MLISVVSPVYRAKEIVPELVRRIEASISQITEDFEVILVEDGCPENSWEAIEAACLKSDKIKGIKLSRNFGQHYAITAGLQIAKGEWIVVMDCDLQDQPEEIPNLFKKALKGYEIVLARRKDRKDSFCKTLSSKMFHSVYSCLSGFKSDPSVANFGIYQRIVIKEYLRMREMARSFPSLINSLGFNRISIDVTHAPRLTGTSSYSAYKLLRLTFDVIIANSNKPLKLTVKLGFLISTLSFSLAIYNLIANLIGIIKVPGYTSTIFSIWFVGGLILFVLGIIGLYVGKIFDEVKGRPLFIISKLMNIEDESKY
jgi:glycosyltransferase involved in cell wall biosynthesis